LGNLKETDHFGGLGVDNTVIKYKNREFEGSGLVQVMDL
jgi:hypothetical protein